MKEVKRTPLYEKHVEAQGTIVEFAGYELPIQYSGLTEEHKKVRHKAGIFDVSHMGEIEIIGPDALIYVQNLITNDVKSLLDHQVLYTMMCYENGTVVDDLLVYRFNENHFFLVINAANVDKDYEWMLNHKGSYHITIANLSDKTAQIALQGPLSQSILQELVDFDLSEIKFFFCKRDVNIRGMHALISRTGYTGEDGFEIYVDNKDAEQLWALLLETGKENISPIGLGARDTLRFEACLPLYGHEISDAINPLEAGLGMFVKLETDDFIGKEALVIEKKNGIKRKLVGIELTKGIAREGYKVFALDAPVGYVTTGYKAPSVNKSVALALVDVEHGKIGTPLTVQVRKKKIDCHVISKRFYKKNYKK